MPQAAFASRRARTNRAKPSEARVGGSDRSNAQSTVGPSKPFPFNLASIPIFAPRPSPPRQRGLEIGAASDPLEHATDRTAAAVVSARNPAAAEPGVDSGSRVSSASKPGIPAPPSVHAALGAPGRPLDADTRAFFEPRFRRDFSEVRVHTDDRSAASARDIHAQAYTFGRHIVFGPNQFAPNSLQGMNLLAHELAHVAQSNGQPTQVRRKVPTWAGDFDAAPYFAFTGEEEDGTPICGARINLKFAPKPEFVEADKIALVQVATTVKNNKVVSMANRELGETKGWTPADSSGHVDTKTRSPLYGQQPGSDSKLSSSTPITGKWTDVGWDKETITDFGYVKKSGKSVDSKNAWLYDQPSLPAAKGDSVSQHFETAAVAVEGKQRGAFYGSALWGYDKAAGQEKPVPQDLKIGASAIPSAGFLSAAKAWNQFNPPKGSVLPLPVDQFSSDAKLYAQQDSKSGNIKAGDEVTLLPPSASTKSGESEVIVVSGSRKGNQGTLPTLQVTSKPPSQRK